MPEEDQKGSSQNVHARLGEHLGSALRTSLGGVGRSIASQHFARRHLTRGTPRAFLIRDDVLGKAFLLAVPCGLAAALVRLSSQEYPEMWETLGNSGSAWAPFSQLVIFLVVFRTSQSASRFWEGCTAIHHMKAEWFDACSALVAFCFGSAASASEVTIFKHTLVRLFSMLHGIALAEVEDRPEGHELGIETIEAFTFELIDPEAIDDKYLENLMKCPRKVELLFQWIQNVIMSGIQTGVLVAPAPLLTRSLQELNSGMVAFHNALKVSTVPVPLPYVQACDWMLMLHYCFLPLLVPQWVGHPGWAFAFCFIQIFILWALKFTASEIENPFGRDSNDLDRHHLQTDMNSALRTLLEPSFNQMPRLRRRQSLDRHASYDSSTFMDLVFRMDRERDAIRSSAASYVSSGASLPGSSPCPSCSDAQPCVEAGQGQSEALHGGVQIEIGGRPELGSSTMGLSTVPNEGLRASVATGSRWSKSSLHAVPDPATMSHSRAPKGSLAEHATPGGSRSLMDPPQADNYAMLSHQSPRRPRATPPEGHADSEMTMMWSHLGTASLQSSGHDVPAFAQIPPSF